MDPDNALGTQTNRHIFLLCTEFKQHSEAKTCDFQATNYPQTHTYRSKCSNATTFRPVHDELENLIRKAMW